ncbi:hypothetical protein A0J61_07769 [Choanephora cucurbitarum]|uniref:Uncharacterized protein n=1 Tax=Choanephora cucurbitarum TaxID=101091 RepID=A0A1C7N5B8_9FUNG|nr:hypothetical protein A0J61_07769 [Choanephora cucurbitarum]
MSRFTEHFDLDTSQFIMYSQTIHSPSKVSFCSLSSVESTTAPSHQHTVNSSMTQSFSSFDTSNSGNTTPINEEEEKPFSTKLKRFLTTISKKKKRSICRSLYHPNAIKKKHALGIIPYVIWLPYKDVSWRTIPFVSYITSSDRRITFPKSKKMKGVSDITSIELKDNLNTIYLY